MTSISLHMQWPMTSQSHGSLSQREQLVFHYRSNSTPNFENQNIALFKTIKTLHTLVGLELVFLIRSLLP
jgi:hypothetical protein